MKRVDAIIIGFGKGGKILAADLAKRNWEVAMVERSDKMYGGSCINIGCIPTKTLVHDAQLAANRSNLSFGEKREYYRQAILRKDEVTSFLREKNYKNLADLENVTVYTGEGSFIDSDTVRVHTEEEDILLQSAHIFINTGAETVIPPLEGIQENPYVYTSTSLMELADLPRRLVIVGGGYVGLEFASMYASFGSEVFVLEGYSELIPREDRDIAAQVKEVLEKKGISFHLNAKVTHVKQREKGVKVTYEDVLTKQKKELEAEAVLLATGRRPNTTELHLDKAGMEVDERGAIRVDEHLKTTNPHIWALGDVKGGLQFTYISQDDYRIIRENLFGKKERNLNDREPVSYSVFIDPPLARIGMSEEDARKQQLDIRVNKLAVAAIPRARTLGQTEGIFKAIIDRRTDKILGCTLFGPEASEVINMVALAMKSGQSAAFLRDFIFTHPSMSEALNELFG